jgi:hypothetical protein
VSVSGVSGIDILKIVNADALYDDVYGALSLAPDRRDEPQQWSRSRDTLE